MSSLKEGEIEIQSTVALTQQERDAIYARARELDATIVLVRPDEIGWLACEYRRRNPRCRQRPFERIRRITGYLVGTLDRWNSAKQAEERDRVKHGVTVEESRVLKDKKTRREIVSGEG